MTQIFIVRLESSLLSSWNLSRGMQEPTKKQFVQSLMILQLEEINLIPASCFSAPKQIQFLVYSVS